MLVPPRGAPPSPPVLPAVQLLAFDALAAALRAPHPALPAAAATSSAPLPLPYGADEALEDTAAWVTGTRPLDALFGALSLLAERPILAVGLTTRLSAPPSFAFPSSLLSVWRHGVHSTAS